MAINNRFEVTPTLKSKPKILIVNSDVAILDRLSKLLENIDCNIYKATNGLDAFELALKYEFNVVISGISLSGIDGPQFVIDFRKLPYGKESIFFFITEPTSEDLQVKCIEDGADDIIVTPINAKVLKSKIESIIKRFKSARFIRQSLVKQNINVDIGKILFCKSAQTKDYLKNLNIEVEVITNINELVVAYKNTNIWMIFIDNRAKWALDGIDKMVQVVGSNIPFWLITTHNSSEKFQKKFIDKGGFGVLFRHKRPELLTHQINVLVERETSIRNQYINTIKQAVKSSPVHFETNYKETFPSFTLNVKYEPYMKPAGGDFYEVVKLDNGNTLILLGDVMGKKWGAWFFANAYLAYIRASLRVFPTKKQDEIGDNLGLLMDEINQFLYKDIQLSDAFTTLLAVLVIPSQNRVKITAAGAIPPIFFSYNDGKTSLVPAFGKILGISENEHYNDIEIETHPNDKMLLLTDGIVEAFDSTNGQVIGIENVVSAVSSSLEKDKVTLDELEKQIATSNNVTSFNDDRTMILLNFK